MGKWVELVGTPAVGKTTLLRQVYTGDIREKFLWGKGGFLKTGSGVGVVDEIKDFQQWCVGVLSQVVGCRSLSKKREKILVARSNVAQYLQGVKEHRSVIFDEFLLQSGLAIASLVDDWREFLSQYVVRVPLPSYIIFIEGEEKAIERRLRGRGANEYRFGELRQNMQRLLPTLKEYVSYYTSIPAITINIDRAKNARQELLNALEGFES